MSNYSKHEGEQRSPIMLIITFKHTSLDHFPLFMACHFLLHMLKVCFALCERKHSGFYWKFAALAAKEIFD